MRLKSIAAVAVLMAGITLAGCGSDDESSPDRDDLINQLVDELGSDAEVRECARKGLKTLSTEDLQTLATDQPIAAAQQNAGLPITVSMSPELAAKREAISVECFGTQGPTDMVPATDVEGQFDVDTPAG